MDISGAALFLMDVIPLGLILIMMGVAITILLKTEGSLGSVLVTFTFLVVGLALIPAITSSLRGIESGGLTDEPSEESFNFTVMAKGLEYERGFFGARKKYVLILSDGEKYSVPRDVYDLYDTGDAVTITISANRREVTFK